MISPDDPKIAPYRSLRANLTHFSLDGHPLFIAESEEVIRALLASNCIVESFLILKKYASLFKGRSEPIYCVDEEVMKQITGYKMHQGIMALVRRPENVPLKTLGKRLVVLNGLADAENIGAIIRCCAAFGVTDLIIDHTCSTPYLRRSVKVSRGAIFSCRVHLTEDLSHTFSQLKERDYSLIATSPQGEPIQHLQTPQKYALIFGSEGAGIAPSFLNMADHQVAIEMKNGVDSLNVAQAAAVFLYHLEMQ